MNKLIPEFFENKLKLYDYQKLIIENYQKIVDITSNLIIVDRYCITGEKLKVNCLNQFIIEINGDIQEIKIK